MHLQTAGLIDNKSFRGHRNVCVCILRSNAVQIIVAFLTLCIRGSLHIHGTFALGTHSLYLEEDTIL